MRGACSRRPPTGRTSTPPRSASRAGGSRRRITRSSTSGQPRPRLRPRRAGRGRRTVGGGPADRRRARDVALIPSVSSAAGLVAAQFGPASPGENVVIGEREYSSNHFPWRQLAGKGYDVRQVPFRNGGLEPEDVARARRRGHPAGRVQRRADRDRAPVRHRRDQRARARGRRDRVRRRLAAGRGAAGGRRAAARRRVGGAGSQVPAERRPRHGLLLPLARRAGAVHAGQRGLEGGRVPFESFFGPEMDLSPTASRFDNSISWLAAIGNEAALAVFDDFGPDAIYARNRELTARSGRPSPTRMGPGRPAGTQPEHDRHRPARRRRAGAAARALPGGRHLLGAGRQPAARGPLLQPRRRHRAARRRPSRLSAGEVADPLPIYRAPSSRLCRCCSLWILRPGWMPWACPGWVRTCSRAWRSRTRRPSRRGCSPSSGTRPPRPRPSCTRPPWGRWREARSRRPSAMPSVPPR